MSTASVTASTSKSVAAALVSPSLINIPFFLSATSPVPSTRRTTKSVRTSTPHIRECVRPDSTRPAPSETSAVEVERELQQGQTEDERRAEHPRKRSLDPDSEAGLLERPTQRIRETSLPPPLTTLSQPQQHLLALLSSTSSAAPPQSIPSISRRSSSTSTDAESDADAPWSTTSTDVTRSRASSPRATDLQLRRKQHVGRSASVGGTTTPSCSGTLVITSPLPSFAEPSLFPPGLSSASEATESSFGLRTPGEDSCPPVHRSSEGESSKTGEVVLEVVVVEAEI